jgi:hypothetical protein
MQAWLAFVEPDIRKNPCSLSAYGAETIAAVTRAGRRLQAD